MQIEHEKYVSSLIHQLYLTAEDVRDIATVKFLGWYVEEQIEEEKKATDLLDRYDLFAKDSGLGLYQLDKDLAQRK